MEKTLKEQLEDLEKARIKEDAKYQRHIKSLKNRIKQEEYEKTEAEAQAFMEGNTRFYIGNIVAGITTGQYLRDQRDILVITGDAVMKENGSHKYASFPCVRIDTQFGYTGEKSTFTMQTAETSAGELRFGYKNVSQQEFNEVFQKWQGEFTKVMQEELIKVPGLIAGQGLLTFKPQQ